MDPSDDGDVERARDDRHVRGGRALLEHQALEAAAVIVEQLGRSHRAGDEDEFLRQLGGGGGKGAPGQVLLQPRGEIVEVGQALAQI